jgi:hypothetical protein
MAVVGAAARGFELGRGGMVATGDIKICSTSPVHEPQPPLALVVFARFIEA